MPLIDYLLLGVISVFGLTTLLIVYKRMKPGFGAYNLRIIGIVLVATFASLLAIKDQTALSAAMGILGGIAGYLFGLKSDGEAKPPAVPPPAGAGSPSPPQTP